MALSFLISDFIQQQVTHQGQLMAYVLVAVPSLLGVIAVWPDAFRINVGRLSQGEQKPISPRIGPILIKGQLSKRTSEIDLLQNGSIHALTELARLRDSESGNHLGRTEEYVRILATQLRRQSSYTDHLDTTAINLMAKSAPLHDIGKVGIPD